MKKPKLECPEGHPMSDEWIMSLWGRLIQWKGYKRLGKKEMNRKKAENFKKSQKGITITRQKSGIYQAFIKGQEQIGFGGSPEEAETNLRLKLKKK